MSSCTIMRLIWSCFYACDEGRFNDVFIDRVDLSTDNHIRHYRTQDPQSDLIGITFKVQWLSSIQKSAEGASATKQNTYTTVKYTIESYQTITFLQTTWIQNNSTSTCSARNRFESPPMLQFRTSDGQISVVAS